MPVASGCPAQDAPRVASQCPPVTRWSASVLARMWHAHRLVGLLLPKPTMRVSYHYVAAAELRSIVPQCPLMSIADDGDSYSPSYSRDLNTFSLVKCSSWESRPMHDFKLPDVVGHRLDPFPHREASRHFDLPPTRDQGPLGQNNR